MKTFEELAAARRGWIDDVLKPWCAQASRRDLAAAEQEWVNLAGKADPHKTLWYWAWGRFADLVHEELAGIDETAKVRVILKNGEIHQGFPDARETQNGNLALLAELVGAMKRVEPFSIDEIVSVKRIDSQ